MTPEMVILVHFLGLKPGEAFVTMDDYAGKEAPTAVAEAIRAVIRADLPPDAAEATEPFHANPTCRIVGIVVPNEHLRYGTEIRYTPNAILPLIRANLAGNELRDFVNDQSQFYFSVDDCVWDDEHIHSKDVHWLGLKPGEAFVVLRLEITN